MQAHMPRTLQQSVGLPEMPAHRQALQRCRRVQNCPVCLQCTAVRFDLNICSAYAK